MGLFSWLFGGGSSHDATPSADDSGSSSINPATGLPMVGGMGGVDVAGNPYGTSDDSWSSISNSLSDDSGSSTVNPATGLPMVGGMGGIDMAGNPYGTSDDDSWSSSSSNFSDDCWSSSSGCNGN